MTEAGIGRILVASLHQGIADLLPTRLEFYENWLNPDGLRHGTIGLAPLHAVLSFLRQEGDAYGLITQRAGQYAAEWTVASQWPMQTSLIRSLPVGLRAQVVLRLARRTIRSTYIGSRAIVRVRKGRGAIDVRGSIFCNTREPSPEPLCGFYAAAASRFLELYGVPGEVRPGQCRAVGDPACLLDVAISVRRRPSAASLPVSE
jgi:bacteriochlorophyll 4-vinyl reductase